MSRLKYTLLYLVIPMCWQNVCLQAQDQTYTLDEIKKQGSFLSAFVPSIYGKQKDAIKSMENFAEQNPRNSAAQYQLARMLFKNDRTNKALPYAQKAVRLDRSNRWYRIMEADILSSLKRYNEAAQIYENLYKTYSNDDFALNQAYLLLKSGEPDRSLEVLENLENQIGIREGISQKKILIYETLQRDEDVENEYLKLIDLDPENRDYHFLLAEFYNSRSMVDKAREYYRRVLEIDPKDNRANYAIINLQSEKSTSVKTSTDKVGSILADCEVSEDEKIRILVPYLQQLDLKQESQIKQLVEWSEELSALYPQSAKSSAFLGDTYYYTGMIPKAKKAYEKSLAKTQAVYAVWEKYLEILEITQDYQKLLEESKAAMRYFPNRAKLYSYHAYAAYQVNQKREAISLLMNAEMMAGKNILLKQEIKATKLLLMFNEKQYHSILNQIKSVQYVSPKAIQRLIKVSQDHKLDLKPIKEIAIVKLKDYPDKQTQFFIMAELFYLDGDYKKALSNIKKSQALALGIKPNINYLHALILEKMDNSVEAEKLKQLAINQGYIIT